MRLMPRCQAPLSAAGGHVDAVAVDARAGDARRASHHDPVGAAGEVVDPRMLDMAINRTNLNEFRIDDSRLVRHGLRNLRKIPPGLQGAGVPCAGDMPSVNVKARNDPPASHGEPLNDESRHLRDEQ
jgi:hypothetical protein